MKPTKNRVFCYDCNRPKMLFKTEKKALNFIRFNSEAIKEETGYAPTRAYYCEVCGGWHVTSLEDYGNNGRTHTQAVVLRYNREKAGLENMRNLHKSLSPEPMVEERSFLCSVESTLEKAEDSLQSGCTDKARVHCFNVIDRLKSNLSCISDRERYARLIERLNRCVEKCQTPKQWLKKADSAIDDAIWHLSYGSLCGADKAFHDAIGFLTQATCLNGDDEEKKLLFHRLEKVQSDINAVFAYYENCA